VLTQIKAIKPVLFSDPDHFHNPEGVNSLRSSPPVNLINEPVFFEQFRQAFFTGRLFRPLENLFVFPSA
jgi:hypothetical protein